ncbi:hypothetical protein JXO59_07360, partial [candidate division KSB1 bacterium]|nr:hypothetical protein [candidate division KSB1 bacterium]
MAPSAPTTPYQWLALAMGLLILLILLYASFISCLERERRAMQRLLALSLLLPLPYAVCAFFRFPAHEFMVRLLVALPILGGFILFLPLGRRRSQEDDSPIKRVDERDTIFARYYLQPESQRFKAYYLRHPEKAAADARFRSKPGLLSPGAALYHPHQFAAADAGFAAVTAFHTMLDGEPAKKRIRSDAAQMSTFIKNWGVKLGAAAVGITELRDYHLYSNLGRNEPYGAPIEHNHQYAIAFTVEMDKCMLDHAPLGPTVMESAQQYLHAGAIAVQIACFIRNLGYSARAHVDGNYRVICPLVARDAGLGEIGRMGLLMTPR